MAKREATGNPKQNGYFSTVWNRVTVRFMIHDYFEFYAMSGYQANHQGYILKGSY